MARTVAQLARSFHDILKAAPGADGRRKVCELLKEALRDRAFINAIFNDDTPERHLLYQDPELGFCILAHNNKGAKGGSPHDHGPSWAIYGQADGETHMTDWDLIEPATGEKAGKARRRATYTLKPGDAHLYNEGVLHSPHRDGPTRLIRIEGINLASVRRHKFEGA